MVFILYQLEIMQFTVRVYGGFNYGVIPEWSGTVQWQCARIRRNSELFRCNWGGVAGRSQDQIVGWGSVSSEFIAQNLITVNRTRIITEMMLDIWVALDRLDGGWGGRVGGGGRLYDYI